jgi:hypothetical protein
MLRHLRPRHRFVVKRAECLLGAWSKRMLRIVVRRAVGPVMRRPVFGMLVPGQLPSGRIRQLVDLPRAAHRSARSGPFLPHPVRYVGAIHQLVDSHGLVDEPADVAAEHLVRQDVVALGCELSGTFVKPPHGRFEFPGRCAVVVGIRPGTPEGLQGALDLIGFRSQIPGNMADLMHVLGSGVRGHQEQS